ncbi:hypothetical protein DFH28DRAFT_1132027 [Melampsora americana]|nr:hypothetical protein DFH28DRAFT_1132027 [Melampsora americana]
MEDYLRELEAVIKTFYNQVIKNSAQWVNKPKFHMVSHLKDSIQRFGPATLFMTQKFECYNGVLRAASVHSNRMSPGRDIANAFNTYQCMRAILSGNTFFDNDLGARCSAGVRVKELLKTVAELPQALGLDPNANQEGVISVGPRVRGSLIPVFLTNRSPNTVWQEFSSVTLANKQVVESSAFVKLKDSITVLQVVSIWKPEGSESHQCVLLLRETRRGGVDAFYGMREIIRGDRENWCNITWLLNRQHNCNRDICPVTNGPKRRIERRDCEASVSTVAHIDNGHFIVNSASHYSAEAHRQVASISHQPLSPAEWMETLLQGLKTWHSVPVNPRHKPVGKRKANGPPQDSSSEDPEAEEDMEVDAASEVNAPDSPPTF